MVNYIYFWVNKNKNEMESQLELLKELSKQLNLNLFYVIRFWSNEVTLQGKKQSRKEISEVFKIENKLSENGWFESQHEFMDCNIKIILT